MAVVNFHHINVDLKNLKLFNPYSVYNQRVHGLISIEIL